MADLTDFNPGDAVVYRANPGARPEDGTVVRVSDTFVFVLYRGDSTPKATSPLFLERHRG